MSTYQRYLRERKEVEIEEQDLEEAVVKGIGDVTDRPRFRGKVNPESPKSTPAPPAVKATKTPPQNALGALGQQAPSGGLGALNRPSDGTKQNTPSSTPSTGGVDKRKQSQQKRLDKLKEKDINSLTPQEIQQYNNLTSELGLPVPPEIRRRERELSKSNLGQEKNPPSDKLNAPVSGTSEVAGNNISQILASGGITDPKSIQNVKKAFLDAARKLNVQIKPGFDA